MASTLLAMVSNLVAMANLEAMASTLKYILVHVHVCLRVSTANCKVHLFRVILKFKNEDPNPSAYSFLLLVVRPGAPSSVPVPSSDALCS